MEISKAAAGFLAALCVTAGAGTAWLVRQSGEASVRANTTSVSGDPAAAPLAVEQSEAVIMEPEAAPPAPPRRTERPAPAPRRAATPARRAERPAPAPARPFAPEPIPQERVAPPVVVEPEVAQAYTPPAPPARAIEELIVSADSVIGLQIESALSSEEARVEDEVVARVIRDVKVGDRVAIPAGAQAVGEVTLVERGGKVREKARLGVRFTSIVLADGTRVPVETDTIIREGSPPGNESAAKIGGGAIGGAIIGGILGGARGALIGGSAGAGAGTAAVMAGGRNPATLPAGAPVTVRLLKAATVTVEP